MIHLTCPRCGTYMVGGMVSCHNCGMLFPAIVCLCGSTRFKEAFVDHNARLTLEGKIVLSVGLWGHDQELRGLGRFPAPEIKAKLDELHLRKIDIADCVLVLNVGGYIGESTKREIAYAIKTGKPVEYLEPLTE